ncbi:MAG: hypothetical protein ACI9KN_002412 [Gammaproteobacteria bacterium]|jgi:hypothetical protein
MKKKILNLAIFQIGWAVCVLGGGIYAIEYTIAALLAHHHFINETKSEWYLISIVTVVGCLWDILMVQSGMILYAESGLFGIPVWLVCIWILFATTFMHGLAWLNRYLWLAGLLAAGFGPLSYWFGVELSDASFGTPVLTSLLVVATGWSVLFPMGIYVTRRFRQ